MNAILMGVVVEGIDFYGVGELFLIGNKTEMTFYNSMSISLIYTFILFSLYIFAWMYR